MCLCFTGDIERERERQHEIAILILQYFRAITSMSPLQYQKQLRLQEARRLMLTENYDAGGAALEVGYESTTQFSREYSRLFREYSRLFGQPPIRNVRALRQVQGGDPLRPVV